MATRQKRATTKNTTANRTTSRKSQDSEGSQKRAGNGSSGTHIVENLEEGFLGELSEMLYAERELMKALPKLSAGASTRRLRDVLEWHVEQSEEQEDRLERILKLFGRKAEVEVCKGMQGILAESKDLLQKTGEGPVRDAMLIAATQKAVHYKIAAYGTLCSWAEQLEEDQALRLLENTLQEDKAIDRNLTRIAESLSNPEAERGEFRSGRERGGFSNERRFGGEGEYGRDREDDSSRRMRDERDPRFEDRSRSRSGREKRYND